MLNFEDLVYAVDARVHRSPAERDPGGYLYAVVTDPSEPDGIDVELLAVADGPELFDLTALPPGSTALALSIRGWGAPGPEPGEEWIRPSRHPQRYRLHQTMVVNEVEFGAVQRTGGGCMFYLDKVEGLLYEYMVECWDRLRSRGAA